MFWQQTKHEQRKYLYFSVHKAKNFLRLLFSYRLCEIFDIKKVTLKRSKIRELFSR